MAHESNTTTLGGGTEKRDLGFLLTELVGIELHGIPCGAGAGVLVVLKICNMDPEPGVRLNNASVTDLQVRNERGPEIPKWILSG
jgi:hypothetical protein